MSTAHQREIWSKATRKWNEKNPGYKAGKLAEKRQDPEHRARERARARANYDPEKARVKSAKYRAANPEYFAQQAAKRRALERSSICICCTDKQRQEVYEFARIGGLHVDHIKALHNGGAHCTRNMQLLTPSLNSQKGTT